MGKPIGVIRWEEDLKYIEQDIFRQLLSRLPFDPEGEILNFTLDSKTGVIDISYKLAFKSSKEIASIIKRNMKSIPVEVPRRDALERTMAAEWRGYKDITNRILKIKRGDE
jgi:hypothetical protein